MIALTIAADTESLGYGQTCQALKEVLETVGYHPGRDDLDRMTIALFGREMTIVRTLTDDERLIATVRLNIEIAQSEADKGAKPIEWGTRVSQARMLANEFIKECGPEDFEAVKTLAELATRKINPSRR